MRITWEILIILSSQIGPEFLEFDQNFLRICVRISDENLIFFEKKTAIIFLRNSDENSHEKEIRIRMRMRSDFSWVQEIFQLLFPFSFLLLGITQQRNAAKKQKPKWLGVFGLFILMSCCFCKNKIILLNHKLTILLFLL